MAGIEQDLHILVLLLMPGISEAVLLLKVSVDLDVDMLTVTNLDTDDVIHSGDDLKKSEEIKSVSESEIL
jgi:hypothetical protein